LFNVCVQFIAGLGIRLLWRRVKEGKVGKGGALSLLSFTLRLFLNISNAASLKIKVYIHACQAILTLLVTLDIKVNQSHTSLIHSNETHYLIPCRFSLDFTMVLFLLLVFLLKCLLFDLIIHSVNSFV
jgi:hypothetical protein